MDLCTDFTIVYCLRQELDIERETKKSHKTKKKSKR